MVFKLPFQSTFAEYWEKNTNSTNTFGNLKSNVIVFHILIQYFLEFVTSLTEIGYLHYFSKTKCKNKYLFLVINAIIVTKAICQMSEYEIKFL